MSKTRLDRVTKFTGWYALIGLLLSQLMAELLGDAGTGLSGHGFTVFMVFGFAISVTAMLALVTWIGCKIWQFVRRRRAV